MQKKTVFSLAWQLVPTGKCKLKLIEGLLLLTYQLAVASTNDVQNGILENKRKLI
jgi:hypothetical protein